MDTRPELMEHVEPIELETDPATNDEPHDMCTQSLLRGYVIPSMSFERAPHEINFSFTCVSPAQAPNCFGTKH